MLSPLISIITINFNDALGLEKTILSVCSQTFRNFEHIIIDGGSKDKSQEIITKYQGGFSKWVSESDKGIYDAQNKGIGFANGKYCLFLNSGDYLVDKSVLENAERHILVQDDSIGIFYGDIIIPLNNGKEKRLFQPKRITDFHLFKDTIWHPAAFIKTDLFKKIGYYSLNFKISSDYEFWIKSKKNMVVFCYLPFPIAFFNQDGLSSLFENQRTLSIERKKIQFMYFGKKAYYYRFFLSFINLYKISLIKIKTFIKYRVLEIKV
jgi:glycosyltransferase involved in cell wall biosynthesis